MKSGWLDGEAQAAIDRYAREQIGRDLALRVYTTRLLGREPQLVLHGGGNTSVKTTTRDLLGEEVEALCVKGSGADMAAIEPAGLPALRLDRLRKLRTRAALSDEEMVRVPRANLLDPMAPNPSVEALLHAFLPHRYVDHTHANAVLSLVDQPHGAAICAGCMTAERASSNTSCRDFRSPSWRRMCMTPSPLSKGSSSISTASSPSEIARGNPTSA